MKKYISNEFRRVILSKNAIIVFVITLVSLLVAFLDFIDFPSKYAMKDIPKMYDAVDIFIRIRSTSRASFLVVIAPLLAALVFSDSYLTEKDTGFLRFIYLRVNQKKYVRIKLLINAIASGVVISFASIIVLGSLVFLYGIGERNTQPLYGGFEFIYLKSRLLYAIFLIIISFIFNVIFATLGLGLSPWIKNRYLTVIAPFLYYIVSGTILSMFGFKKYFSLNGTILFDLNPTVTELNIIIYQLFLLFIGISTFYIGVIYHDKKNI